MPQLKGLGHLDIKISWSAWLCSGFDGDIWKTLENFANENDIEALGNLRLKSLRITLEVEFDHIMSMNPDPAAVIAWQKRLETG